MADISTQLIVRYLQDAIAAEKGFETQVNAFVRETTDPDVKASFQGNADDRRSHIERLSKRLEELGGAPSTAKSLLSQVFNLTPKVTHAGSEKGDFSRQDLILAFTIQNNELAMYEALASTADAAADPETASLVRALQSEQKASADRCWASLNRPYHQTAY